MKKIRFGGILTLLSFECLFHKLSKVTLPRRGDQIGVLSSSTANVRSVIFLSRQTVADFDYLLRQKLLSTPGFAANEASGIMPEGYLEAPLAYDAIWAVALGEWVSN